MGVARCIVYAAAKSKAQALSWHVSCTWYMTTMLLQGLVGRMPVDLFNKWTQKAGGGGSVQ